MLKSYHSRRFVQYHGGLTFFSAFVGLFLPGHEMHMPRSKTLYFLIRKSHYVCLFVHIIFCIDCSLDLVHLIYNGDMNAAWRRIIHTINFLAVLQRLMIFIFRSKQIEEIVYYLDNILDNGMRRLNKKEEVMRTVRRLSYFGLFHLVFLCSQSAFFLSRHVYRTHLPPVSTSYMFLPVPVICVYEVVAAFVGYTISSLFLWTLSSFLNILCIELKVLRKELGEIYSILQIDERGNLFVKRNRHLKGIEVTNQGLIFEMAEPDPNRDYTNVILADKNPEFKDSQLQQCDILLRDWINRHNNAIKCVRAISDTFSGAIEVTYINVTLLTSSFIVTSISGRQPFSLAIYSFAAVGALYLLCMYGNRCVTEGQRVAMNALGKDFHLYPIRMQKALRMIIISSQEITMEISFYRLHPLTFETFYEVMKVCYSLLGFAATLNIRE